MLEYSKSVIENTVLLPVWEKQVQRDARAQTVLNLLDLEGMGRDLEHIRQQIGDLGEVSKDVLVSNAVNLIDEARKVGHMDDDEIKFAFFRATKTQAYQSTDTLPRIVELFDWVNSIDARETHPIIVSGILMAKIHDINPFGSIGNWYANFVLMIYLKLNLYNMRDYAALGDAEFVLPVNSIVPNEEADLTEWLEVFTQGFASKVVLLRNTVENIATDIVIDNVKGQSSLNDREQDIVLYLQDYGHMQNKDFNRLFPNVSEDTVLRTLKKLIEKNIVIKKGSTKSSRYELI